MVERNSRYSLRSKIFCFFLVIIFFQASVICFLKPSFYYYLSGIKNYRTDIEEEQFTAWPSDKPRNLTNFIRPYENTTIIRPINCCNSSTTFLNIIVTSGPDQKDQRVAIRQTWASKKRINDKEIVVNFLVGHTNNNTLTNLVKQEADEYGDINQEAFIDSYYNLTIKVGMMFKWIKNNYPDTKNYKTQIENVWPYDKPRNLFVYVKPYEVTTTIEPIHQHNQSEIFLNIIVITAPNHEDQRIAIRQTWASKKRINNKNIAVNFLVGQTNNNTLTNLVKQESDKYGDIIQESFIDSYYNLTIKVGMMFKWIKNNYPDTKYILKADDDVYIDIPNLLKNLSQHDNSSEELLMGQLNTLSLPNGDQYNKWYMPNYMYSESTYPPYLDGPAYIMSQAVLRKLYRKALSLSFLHLEDVFFTGICAREAHIDPISNKNFGFLAKPFGLIMKHGITIAEMNRMWKIRSQLNNHENQTVNN